MLLPGERRTRVQPQASHSGGPASGCTTLPPAAAFTPAAATVLVCCDELGAMPASTALGLGLQLLAGRALAPVMEPRIICCLRSCAAAAEMRLVCTHNRLYKKSRCQSTCVQLMCR